MLSREGLSRGGSSFGYGWGLEAGLRAGTPPLSPRLPPPFVACPPPVACLASRLAFGRRGGGVRSRCRGNPADDGQLFQAVARIVKHPRPATVVHALVVEFQEAGGD
jgi:hypothetical protein